jgi:hypothetical protein
VTLPVDPVALSVAGAGSAYVIADGRVRRARGRVPRPGGRGGGGGGAAAPRAPAAASPSSPGSR